MTDAEIKRITQMHGGYRIVHDPCPCCGKPVAFAVFRCEFDAVEYNNKFPEHFGDCDQVPFGKGYNAFELGVIH